VQLPKSDASTVEICAQLFENCSDKPTVTNFTFEARKSDTIGSMKQKMQRLTGLPPDFQRVTSSGLLLRDNDTGFCHFLSVFAARFTCFTSTKVQILTLKYMWTQLVTTQRFMTCTQHFTSSQIFQIFQQFRPPTPPPPAWTKP
jgi:hypothetical protein